MNAENQVLAIDAGNTSLKVGHFVNGELSEVRRFSLEELDKLLAWSTDLKITKTVISSVLSQKNTDSISSIFPTSMCVNAQTALPVQLNYKSKETLGIDRICNACFIAMNNQSLHAVTIDIGTCIKFDLVHKNDGYLGGSIAPGIGLRYKSLNDYTGNLPLLSNKSRTPLVGNDTNASIQSGVINGMQAEIQRMMDLYSEQFEDLTFFVTGGDATFFEIHSKNDIFADENLTIKGLFEIYRHNA
jgi:type III pantothenate kinase